MPVGTRLLRTITTPFLAAFGAAVHRRLVHVAVAHAGDDDTLGAVIRTEASMRSGDMSACAKMMSTRGSSVTLRDVELALRGVFPRGVIEVVLAVSRDTDEARNGEMNVSTSVVLVFVSACAAWI